MGCPGGRSKHVCLGPAVTISQVSRWGRGVMRQSRRGALVRWGRGGSGIPLGVSVQGYQQILTIVWADVLDF
jgi:hypothetical protein